MVGFNPKAGADVAVGDTTFTFHYGRIQSYALIARLDCFYKIYIPLWSDSIFFRVDHRITVYKIYIPLWSDSISLFQFFGRPFFYIYIPLWSDSIDNQLRTQRPAPQIYIPLWSDSIPTLGVL